MYLFLVYVDDILITGISPQQLKHQLHTEFALRRASLFYFIGIEAKRLECDKLLLSQRKYINDLLVKTKMDGSKETNDSHCTGTSPMGDPIG